MNPETTIPRTRKRYDEAFKRSAVAHWQSSGKSATQIASELGLNPQLLTQWKAHFGTTASPTGVRMVAELEAENRRLRRELHHVAQQRDILKKTLGILSNPSDNVLSA
jgi:transposase